MGGIAGIRNCKMAKRTDDEMVLRMLETISHRGPYTETFSSKDGVVFGIRYGQPGKKLNGLAHDKSRQLLVILDGDIFLFDKDQLDGTSLSDSEVVLRLYSKYGNDFAEKIDGSYAIAIWDGKQKKLLLVRDRLGYKPLFWLELSTGFVFVSEIKAILVCGFYRKSMNLRALNNFLSYGYIPNPDTLFKSIKQVKPGHMLIYKDEVAIQRPYWKFRYRQSGPVKTETHYTEKFLSILETAVSRRLKRYPDAGAFLSGGLDTSGVAAVMRKLRGDPFKVFTAGFKEEQYNEIGDAKIVADHIGLDQYTALVSFDQDFPKLLEKTVWHHDSPFADTSAIPSYYAAKLAREHVETVLTGDFPDQLIGGSGHHVKALAAAGTRPPWKRLIRSNELAKLIARIPWKAGGTSFFDKVKRFLYRETFSLEEQRIIANMPVPPLLKRCLYSTDFLEANHHYDPLDIARSFYEEVEDKSLLDKLLYFDILSYATDDLMVKVERMTMAHGLIAISPFHDRELVEFIATVPAHLKIKGEVRKYIMREAFRPLLPEHTLNKKKQGFAMPIGEWLVRNLSDYVRDVLLDSRTLNRGYFNKKFMRKMVENFLAGKTDYACGNEATIICLITLELWHRIFIDN